MGLFNRKKTIEQGTFNDPRDNKVYKTVKIGNQVWMAENLAFEIPGKQCIDSNNWKDSNQYDKWCYYENNKEQYSKYGILYQWEAARDACPPGWDLPSDEDWEKLCRYIAKQHKYKKDEGGNWKGVGSHLKAFSGWDDGEDGLDDYCFSALPGGLRYGYGSFSGVGESGDWWSSSVEAGGNIIAQKWGMNCYNGEVFWFGYSG